METEFTDRKKNHTHTHNDRTGDRRGTVNRVVDIRQCVFFR